MKFEWFKLLKNPKNILLICCALASLFISLAKVYYAQEAAGKEDYQYIKAIYDEIDPPQNYAGPREAYKLLHHKDEAGNFLSAKDEQMYDILVAIIYLAEDENTARNQHNERERLTLQTQRLTLQQEYLDLGGSAWANEPQLTEKLARNQSLLASDLPLADLETGGPQGWYFLYYLVNHWSQFFALLLLVCLFFDFIPAEFEKGTYRLMLTQPISRSLFYRRKYLAAASLFSCIGLGLLLIGFTSTSAVWGSGSGRYPIAVYQGDGLHFISLSSYLFQSLLLQGLFLSFSLSLLWLLARILRRSLETLAVFFLLMILPNIIYKVASSSNLAVNILPFSFMDSHSSIVSSSTDFLGSFRGSIFLLLLWNGLLLLATQLLARRTAL